ncbi:uncharacterized protein LOC143530431 [Bidens hawaiensis]|uniref:uncharacterized protein LOC143530431 n=1 Tax=Bidens hawaiensis TaxID=980011 RepID=UPI004049B2AD
MRDGSQVWNWSWIRPQFTQSEATEYTSCLNLVQNVVFGWEPDRWTWPSDPTGFFTVHSMKKLLSKSQVAHSLFILEWNNWVPLKTNIFAWKAEMDRASTLVGLTKRNVNAGSVVCRLCDEGEETSDHLLISCFYATMVWQFISNWCQIPPIYAFSVSDLLKVHKASILDRRKAKVLHAIILTTCWCIWKLRNELIFDNKSVNLSKIMEDIKALSYLWIKYRSPFSSISWKDWCNFSL